MVSLGFEREEDATALISSVLVGNLDGEESRWRC